ncbi:MAG: mechanosensitive ion channel family protein [Bacteroidetes bacterium]|nr:MAG: mechanosensitive ion channel family protein [Bacteroidota bacterium]
MTDFQDILQRLLDKVYGWGTDIVLMLPNLVVALLVVLLFIGLSMLVRRLTQRLLQRVMGTSPLVKLLSRLATGLILATGLFVALDLLHLDKAVSSLLAGAGIAGLAIGFAFQDLIANFISGIFLSIRRPFKPGDLIRAQGIMGRVVHMHLRTTTIRLFEGQHVIVPNKELFQGILTNYTTGFRRVDIAVGVSYGEQLEKVEHITLKAITDLEVGLQDPAPRIVFTEFGDSSINLEAQFWIDTGQQADYLLARSAGIKAIKAAYDEAGITIPFPIRTLDFGIKGGETLRHMWPQTMTAN